MTARSSCSRGDGEGRTPVLEALLAVATRLLALSAVPVRRRAVQDELVCAFDRIHTEHGVGVHRPETQPRIADECAVARRSREISR